jgi:hypothetical protein
MTGISYPQIMEWLEPIAWKRCEIVNQAERESLQTM